MIEFKVGDKVTYKPYADLHFMYVVEVDCQRRTFQLQDIPLYALAAEKDAKPGWATSVTTGRSIIESKYFTPCAEMED